MNLPPMIGPLASLPSHVQDCIQEYARATARMSAPSIAPFTDDQIDHLYLSRVAGRGPFKGVREAFHAMVRTIEQAHGIGTDGVPRLDETQQEKPHG